MGRNGAAARRISQAKQEGDDAPAHGHAEPSGTVRHSRVITMSDQFVGTMPVQERHRFDEAGRERYLREHVSGFSGALTIEQFKGGESNPLSANIRETPAFLEIGVEGSGDDHGRDSQD